VGRLDGKGVPFHFKGQGIKPHEWWWCGQQGMLIEYSLIKLLEYVLKLITKLI
jgi:hypothetical protein